MSLDTHVPSTHPKFGRIVSFGIGNTACEDCGDDPHEGDCVVSTCTDCGAEVGSRCSLHPTATVRVTSRSRRVADRLPKIFCLTAIGDGDRSVGEDSFRETVTVHVSNLRGGTEEEFLDGLREFLANWYDVREDRVMTADQFEALCRAENEAEAAMERIHDQLDGDQHFNG